jgi:protein SCO1
VTRRGRGAGAGRPGPAAPVGALLWGALGVLLLAVLWLGWRHGGLRSPDLPHGQGTGARLGAPTDPPGELLDLACVERSGRGLTTAELSGRFLVADFVFTYCTATCDLLTREMHRLQEATRDASDLTLLSFSVDPARDTPAVLSAYAERFQADPDRWLFLRCDPGALSQFVSRELLLSGADDMLSHSNRFVLFDRQGKVRRHYTPLTDGLWLESLLRDLGELRAEVSGS